MIVRLNGTGWRVKGLRTWTAAVFPAFCVVVTVLLGGCGLEFDDGSEEEALGIQPLSVTLDAGETADIVFTVRGGSGEYTWSLSDGSLGTLVAGNSTAVYTNDTVTGENVVTASDGNSKVSATVVQQ